MASCASLNMYLLSFASFGGHCLGKIFKASPHGLCLKSQTTCMLRTQVQTNRKVCLVSRESHNKVPRLSNVLENRRVAGALLAGLKHLLGPPRLGGLVISEWDLLSWFLSSYFQPPGLGHARQATYPCLALFHFSPPQRLVSPRASHGFLW